VPIRIYALAKQLKMDNKVLVDICTKAGITGKGSALASLTDEELVKVTAFMEASKSKGTAVRGKPGAVGAAAAPPVLRREDYLPPGAGAFGKIPVLPPKPGEKPGLKKKPDVAAEAPPPAVIEPLPPVSAPAAELAAEPEALQPIIEEPEAPVVAEPVAEAPQAAPPEPVEPPPVPETPKRPPPVSIKPLDRLREKTKAVKDREKPRERDKERTGPAIKLAPVPVSQRPPKKEKSKEPEPQKPDIRLPLDAIRAGRAGTKPLSEHIRKHEEKKAAAAKKGGPRKTAQPDEILPTDVPLTPSPTRDRTRRTARVEVDEVEGAAPTLGGREQRQLKRKRAATVRPRTGEEEDETTATPARRRTHIKRTGVNTAAPRKSKAVVALPCTVREYSEALGVPARTILAKLLELGVMTNIAADLSAEMAELLATELGVEVELQKPVALEQKVLTAFEQTEDDPALLQPRPPVITFLGHVDHGKTSLLDRILGIDVASREKGGITQCIRAYRVLKDDRAITFVDTPGHEAFTAMRARGANVTDIAVLVVAADDGVMPQTEEAISHARAAGVPIVVALNKIDMHGANPQRAYEQLAANELLPTEWGGDTEVVKTSAITGEGIDQLLETLLTVAELHEYKSNPARPATGTCLEAELQEGCGVVAKLLVQKGTLHVGDVVVCGPAYGRVKAMHDTLKGRKKYQDAGPAMPVNVTGLNVAPGAGDRFYVLSDVTQARQLAETHVAAARQRNLSGGQAHVTLETLFERLGQQDAVQTLNIILRADVRGSIEAIRKELTKLEHPEVQIRVLQATVGGISEADVHLADASDAVIIGFNVVPDEKARALADRLGVQIRRYDIIYQVTGDLKAAMEGMLRPEKREKELGRALVQRVFRISRVGAVAGCRVLSGVLQRDGKARVIRDSQIIGEYPLESLKREKDDAREVREGLECGIKLAGFNDVKEGDVFEVYKIEEIRRTFGDGARN
jgi:translation initiation factor IF-2